MIKLDERHDLKLSLAAQGNVRKVLQWSLRKFGAAAATRYGALLTKPFAIWKPIHFGQVLAPTLP